MKKRVEAAANAISESSGMRFDGFWSRVEDLEPEDRTHALAEATAALAAADQVMFSEANIAAATRALCSGMDENDPLDGWVCQQHERIVRDVIAALTAPEP